MVAGLSAKSSIAPRALLQPDEISEAAWELATPDINIRGLVDQLVSNTLYSDALVAVARALPKPYVVSWVCAMVRSDIAQLGTDPHIRSALVIAERWLAQPTDENRESAANAIRNRELVTPGDWLTAAVAWSGGSLTPPGYAVVKPADHLTARAAVAALYLIAARAPDEFGKRLAHFISNALDLFGSEPAGATQQ